MLTLLRDSLAAASLKARCTRLARERVLRLLESRSELEACDDGRWLPVGGTGSRPLDAQARADLRARARRLVAENPHARNVMRLMEVYVVGADCRVSALPCRPGGDCDAAREADRLWRRFLHANCRHFSYREFARRTWRDGECFVRLFRTPEWPPAVRFLDPETIGPTAEHPDSQGVVADPQDAETPLAYLVTDAGGAPAEAVPAAEVLHTKINADSNEPRGVSLFAPLVAPLTQYEKWLEVELVARKLQASIVLWRKVTDGPAASWASSPDRDLALEPAKPERFLPGSILTTSQTTDLQFLQPPSHIRDAAPLGRMILLAAAAGAGLPEYMLTGDASNANYASTMVSEGPAVKLFQSEQRFFAGELSRLWRRVMAEAVRLGLLPAGFLDEVEPDWAFPTVVARDRPRERYADVRLVKAGVLSRSEVARRENVDPATMRAELAEESTLPLEDPAPDPHDDTEPELVSPLARVRP